jgi:hypothetical protein
MFVWLRKNWMRFIVICVFVHFIFFRNLGSYTFASHVYRIFTTPEVHGLVRDVWGTGVGIVRDVNVRTRGLFSRSPYYAY